MDTTNAYSSVSSRILKAVRAFITCLYFAPLSLLTALFSHTWTVFFLRRKYFPDFSFCVNPSPRDAERKPFVSWAFDDSLRESGCTWHSYPWTEIAWVNCLIYSCPSLSLSSISFHCNRIRNNQHKPVIPAIIYTWRRYFSHYDQLFVSRWNIFLLFFDQVRDISIIPHSSSSCHT